MSKKRQQMQHKNNTPLNESERDELARLRRENERLKKWESIYAGGIRQGVDAEWERLQIEVENLKFERAQMIEAAYEIYMEINVDLIAIAKQLSDQIKVLTAVQQNQALSYIPQWLFKVYIQEFEPKTIEQINQSVERRNIIASGGLPLLESWRLALREMVVKGRYAGEQLGAILILHGAINTANDVRFVSKNVIAECDAIGEPRIETLLGFPGEWLKNQLKDAPTSVKLLQYGLKEGAAYMNSDVSSIEIYAELNNKTDKSLRKYVNWYKTIKEEAEK